MSIRRRIVRRMETWVLSILVSRQSLGGRFLDKLNDIRPEEIANKADPVLVSEIHLQDITDHVMRNHGDKVIAALSENQEIAVLERMCESRMADVVEIVEEKAGGTFKHIGHGDIRVVVGSGQQRIEGWLSTDIAQLNIVEEVSWSRRFAPQSIDRILAEHVLEHLTMQELVSALRNAYAYLKPGGIFRVAVPDAFHPSRYYYHLVKPGGWETPYEHMLFIDYEILFRMAKDVGFELKLLEYFDEDGMFHSRSYDEEDGVIRRCARNNAGLDVSDPEVMSKFYSSIPEHLRQQFYDRHMSYTSLIADFVKPQ